MGNDERGRKIMNKQLDSWMQNRMDKVAADFDKYMSERTKEEKVVCLVISTILDEGKGFWVKPDTLSYENDQNYVLKIKDMLELGTFDESTGFFLIEGENTFVELKEITEVYV